MIFTVYFHKNYQIVNKFLQSWVKMTPNNILYMLLVQKHSWEWGFLWKNAIFIPGAVYWTARCHYFTNGSPALTAPTPHWRNFWGCLMCEAVIGSLYTSSMAISVPVCVLGHQSVVEDSLRRLTLPPSPPKSTTNNSPMADHTHTYAHIWQSSNVCISVLCNFEAGVWYQSGCFHWPLH